MTGSPSSLQKSVFVSRRDQTELWSRAWCALLSWCQCAAELSAAAHRGGQGAFGGILAHTHCHAKGSSLVPLLLASCVLVAFVGGAATWRDLVEACEL